MGHTPSKHEQPSAGERGTTLPTTSAAEPKNHAPDQQHEQEPESEILPKTISQKIEALYLEYSTLSAANAASKAPISRLHHRKLAQYQEDLDSARARQNYLTEALRLDPDNAELADEMRRLAVGIPVYEERLTAESELCDVWAGTEQEIVDSVREFGEQIEEYKQTGEGLEEEPFLRGLEDLIDLQKVERDRLSAQKERA